MSFGLIIFIIIAVIYIIYSLIPKKVPQTVCPPKTICPPQTYCPPTPLTGTTPNMCKNYNGVTVAGHSYPIYYDLDGTLKFNSNLTSTQLAEAKENLDKNYYSHCGAWCTYNPSGNGYVWDPENKEWNITNTDCNRLGTGVEEYNMLKERYPNVQWA